MHRNEPEIGMPPDSILSKILLAEKILNGTVFLWVYQTDDFTGHV